MKSAYDIIKKPVLTEKSYDQFASKTYTFEVDKTANKIEIKKAVEESSMWKSKACIPSIATAKCAARGIPPAARRAAKRPM